MSHWESLRAESVEFLRALVFTGLLAACVKHV